MINFLLDEGVITVGTLSGLFTTALLNSLKRNIIDPSIERIAPSHKLDNTPQSPSSKEGESKSGFSDMFPIPTGPMPDSIPTTTIRWQTFLKDLITWIIIMFFLYLFWKFVLHPNKMSKFGSK
jgi:large-conductance mechanosensitive channel